jgi:phenylacetate-CoA ligase
MTENNLKIVPDYWDEDLECISPDHMLEVRTLKMQKHLRYAYQNSPFYRKAFDEVGLRPEEIQTLEDYSRHVPFLMHDQMIQNQKERPPFGDFLCADIKDIRRIYGSPGPLVLPFSKSDMDAYINATANGLYICGARRGDIVDITYAYQWDLAGTMLDDGFRRLGCAVIPGGTGMTRTHIHIIMHLGVTVLFAFPTFAMKLAETAREMGIDPRNDLKVRLIILRGEEIYSPEERSILSEQFGSEVRAMYGGAESGFFAAECPYGGGLHYFADSIVEIIDPVTGCPVRGNEGGEMVATDLSRKAMPVIRYRTGDLVEGLNLEPCPCGRTSPRIKKFVGRTGDIVRVKGVYLIPDTVKQVVGTHESLGKFQIVVDRSGNRERLLIKVESSNPENNQEIITSLIENFRAVTRLRAEINLLPLGSIRQDAPVVIDKRLH